MTGSLRGAVGLSIDGITAIGQRFSVGCSDAGEALVPFARPFYAELVAEDCPVRAFLVEGVGYADVVLDVPAWGRLTIEFIGQSELQANTTASLLPGQDASPADLHDADHLTRRIQVLEGERWEWRTALSRGLQVDGMGGFPSDGLGGTNTGESWWVGGGPKSLGAANAIEWAALDANTAHRWRLAGPWASMIGPEPELDLPGDLELGLSEVFEVAAREHLVIKVRAVNCCYLEASAHAGTTSATHPSVMRLYQQHEESVGISGVGTPLAVAQMEAGGKFVFGCLPEGVFDFTANWWVDGGLRLSVGSVQVRTHVPTQIILEPSGPETVRITGLYLDEDGSAHGPIDLSALGLFLIGMGGDAGPTPSALDFTGLAGNTMRIEGLYPGRYTLLVNRRDGWPSVPSGFSVQAGRNWSRSFNVPEDLDWRLDVRVNLK